MKFLAEDGFAMRIGVVAAAVVFVAFLLVLYYAVDPSSVGWFPQCPFYRLTGLKCAGCGVQRSMHCLLNGEIVAAIRYNAFFCLFVPCVGVCLFCKRLSDIPWFGYGVVIVTFLYVIVRNSVPFPM